MADEILTVAEIAALLKVADKTAYTMAQNSERPYLTVFGQWCFRHQYLDSWMASQVKSPGAPRQPATKPKASTRKGGQRR